MNTGHGILSLKKPAIKIEWKLLIFLVLFMDVKLIVKVSALVLSYLLQPDLRFGFRLKNSRLPLFYLIVTSLTVLNLVFYPRYSGNYPMVALIGILIWAICILAIHQIKLFIEKTDIHILHNTLMVFFIINIAFSFLNLSVILMHIGLRNPFIYQGEYEKYFMNTGDYIKGITFDTSTTNAMINCFAVVYFLYHKKYLLTLLSMATLLITASNFSNITIFLVLAGIFIFKSIREQKSIIMICGMLTILYLSVISPENKSYVAETLNKYILGRKVVHPVPEKIIPIRNRPDSLLTPETRKEKIATLFLDSLERDQIKEYHYASLPVLITKPEIPKDSIHTKLFQWSRDTTPYQQQLISYVQSQHATLTIPYSGKMPGKLLAFEQSYRFLNAHREKVLSGTGVGNFSSKLAFRATGLKMAGGFPQRLLYCNPDFLNNHLSLFAYFFSRPAESHSLIHNRASVYDQLLTEYGVIGLFAFPIYYIGFFLRRMKKSGYGLPVLMILLAFFMVDYWFEQLSVVVLFELILFMNIKDTDKSFAGE